jgi:hypothetical protein
MIIALVLACTRSSDKGEDTGPDSTSDTASECASGLDCVGTAAPTVALARATRLEMIGLPYTELGTDVACTSERVGAFSGAVAAGAWESVQVGYDSRGWTVLLAADRGGRLTPTTRTS